MSDTDFSEAPINLVASSTPGSIPGNHTHCETSWEEKKEILFLVSNCNSGSGRESFVAQFMQHIPVESLGLCFHNKPFPESVHDLEVDPKTGLSKRAAWGDWETALRATLCFYKFQLIVANCLCDDYMDEKLAYALEYGILPIYLGMTNVDDFDPGLQSDILMHAISLFLLSDRIAPHLPGPRPHRGRSPGYH